MTFGDGTVLDCEKVANEGKQNDLYLLNSKRAKVVTFRAFDMLFFEGIDMRLQPLTERLRLLEQKIPRLKEQGFNVELAESLGVALERADVDDMKKAALTRGYEGIVVKPNLSPYRDNVWLKLKRKNTFDGVVIGVKKTKSWREKRLPETFLVGHYAGNETYKRVGTVSSGLSKQQKARIGMTVESLKIGEDKDFVYIKPQYVLEVEFTGIIQGSLREPRILRLRDDKTPIQCNNPPILQIFW